MIGKTVSHYRITARLGEGGMGVVYRAEDQKLDRIVALKFLAPEFVRDSDSKARFIHEAKAASALDHPNICTIHGIEETEDGRLFIAMACYEGETLKDLIGRGPLETGEAVEIAIQVAQGLAKAHSLGIVHRDIKPANVFLTEDGLVKLLDFGIAKLTGQTQVTRPDSLLGTMHYMSPEQLQGGEVDRRSDLWSLGVVLHEMLTGTPPFTGDQQQAIIYSILNAEPTPVSEWNANIPAELELAISKCLRKSPAERHQGVEELLLHLRPLAGGGTTHTNRQRTAGLRSLADARDQKPYPGLASFTEKEAEYFHGRESMVESVWQKLRRGNLLAVAGPSGVGKSSFLRAGLIPAKPADWGVLIMTPGGSPLLSLREALVPELTDDANAIRSLLREHDLDATVAGVRRWRQRHDEALLVLDQFEELFTLSTHEEQAGFAALISRLCFEADVHVLVSLRDDFLFQCHEHAGLMPVFESLSVLGPLTGPTLRRALVQPALDCGYQFEDETLVDEMMAEVEGERGALPLLAFAMSQLWELRDREKGILPRQAYERIGAVSGALARHAETVMDKIGAERHSLVRELFRNLVTAQNTRVVQDRKQMLSVFDDTARQAAEQILNQLIDARLLTSYEIKGEDGATHRRIEIVHESLLSAWPRLVRWQTQDADGAQLRDQLRQATQLWEQKGKTDDLLWTGTAYQEFELWRERYPGGLSSSEESFASAMTQRAVRWRKRRRIAYASSIVGLLAILAVVWGLWRDARHNARTSEARRLHMLAEQVLPEDNTVALALAITGLEREDSPELRRLAMSALWKGPVRSVFPLPHEAIACLSPNGKYLATVTDDDVSLWPASGAPPLLLEGGKTTNPTRMTSGRFSPSGRYLAVHAESQDPSNLKSSKWTHLWSVPDGKLLKVWEHRIPPVFYKWFLRGDPPQVLITLSDDTNRHWSWRRYRLDSDEPEILGHADASYEFKGVRSVDVDPTGSFLLDWKVRDLFLFPLDSLQSASPVLVGSHPEQIYSTGMDWARRRAVTVDLTGKVRIWSLDSPDEPIIELPRRMGKVPFPEFDPSGDGLVLLSTFDGSHFYSLQDLTEPGAERQRIWPEPVGVWGRVGCTPDGEWFVGKSSEPSEVWFMPIATPFPSTYRIYPDSLSGAGTNQRKLMQPMGTMRGGSQLIVQRGYTALWAFDLFQENPECRLLLRHPVPAALYFPVADSLGRYVLACENMDGHAWLIPLDGSEPRTLGGFSSAPQAAAIREDARLTAVGGFIVQEGIRGSIIRIWDLENDEERVLDPGHDFQITGLWFMSGNRLLSASKGGLRLWDLATSRCEILSEREYHAVGKLDPSGRFLVVGTPEGAVLWNLEERTERALPIAFEDDWWFLAISPDICFVLAGRENGDVLYHSLETDETHLLLGHEEQAMHIEVIDGGKKIMSTSMDHTVRVWDIPRGRPLYNRPLKEFLEILRAQTNMRIVIDEETEEGYRIVYDRFTGWETAPTW